MMTSESIDSRIPADQYLDLISVIERHYHLDSSLHLSSYDVRHYFLTLTVLNIAAMNETDRAVILSTLAELF